MLQAMQDEMVRILEGLKTTEQKIAAYKRHWDDTLNGHNKNFPCPACFAAGRENSALKPLPVRNGTHYVRCAACNSVYSYVEVEEDC